MTLIDLLTTRYEYGEGENGARTMRTKTAQTVGIFGKGANKEERPFLPVSLALPAVVARCRELCGPCTRLEVLTALHAAADAQDAERGRQRRNR